MNGFQVYQKYVSIKLHFTGKYDYFKYNKKSNVKIESYNKRKDKFFFEKLAKKFSTEEQIENFFCSNMIYNPNIWIGEFFDDTCDDVYTEWIKKQQSFHYILNNECQTLSQIDNLFVIKNKQYPKLLTKVLQNEISIETLILLDRKLQLFEVWDKVFTDVIWKEFSIRIKKYSQFLKIYDNKYLEIIDHYFKES